MLACDFRNIRRLPDLEKSSGRGALTFLSGNAQKHFPRFLILSIIVKWVGGWVGAWVVGWQVLEALFQIIACLLLFSLSMSFSVLLSVI